MDSGIRKSGMPLWLTDICSFYCFISQENLIFVCSGDIPSPHGARQWLECPQYPGTYRISVYGGTYQPFVCIFSIQTSGYDIAIHYRLPHTGFLIASVFMVLAHNLNWDYVIFLEWLGNLSISAALWHRKQIFNMTRRAFWKSSCAA